MGADRALVVLHRDHRVARVAACDGLDAMGAAKWVGQIIRREQPARVTDATPASIHAGPRRQALRRRVVSQVARRFGNCPPRQQSRQRLALRRGGAFCGKGKPQPNVRIRPGLPRSRSKSDGSDVASLIDCALANPYSEPAGPLAGRLPWAPIPAGERKGYRAVVSISFMTGPIRNQARRVVPLDQRRATTGMTGEESPGRTSGNGRGCAERRAADASGSAPLPAAS
jgi:hypothetical protein